MIVVDLICIPLLFARGWFRKSYDKIALNTSAQTQSCTHFGSTGIQEAVDASGIGNKSILIKSGTYEDVNASIKNKKNLKIEGEGINTILKNTNRLSKIISISMDNPSSLVEQNVISNLSFEGVLSGSDSTEAGIDIGNNAFVKILKSRFKTINSGILVSGSNGSIEVFANRFSDNRRGVIIGNSDSVISNNLFQNHSDDSIYVDTTNTGKKVRIINNTIHQGIGNGIFVYNCKGNPELRIINNIFSNIQKKNIGGSLFKGYAIAQFIPESGHSICTYSDPNVWDNDTIQYNLHWQNQGESTDECPMEVDRTKGKCANYTGRIKAEDPKFESSTDFHLKIGSPAIDSGDPSISDPDGTRSDMGAFGGPGAVFLDPDMLCSVDADCPAETVRSTYSCVAGQRKAENISSTFSCDTSQGVCLPASSSSIGDAPCGFEWRGGDSPWIQQTCRDGKCFSSIDGRTDLQCATDLTATQQQSGNKVTFKWRRVEKDGTRLVTGYILRVNSDPANGSQCKTKSNQTTGWFCKTGSDSIQECLTSPCDDRWILVKTNTANADGMIEYVLSDLKDQTKYAWSVQTIYNNDDPSAANGNVGCDTSFKNENIFTFNDPSGVPKPVFEPISGTKFMESELKVKIKAPNDTITKLEYKINNGNLETVTTGSKPFIKEITITDQTTIEAWSYINEKKSDKATATYSKASIVSPSGLSYSCHESGQAVTFNWNEQTDAGAYLIRINRDETGTSGSWTNFDPSDSTNGDYVFFVDNNTAYVPYIQAHTQYASWTIQPLITDVNDPEKYNQTIAFEVSGGGFICTPQGPDIPLVNPYETPTFLEGVRLTGSKQQGAGIWEATRNQIVPSDTSTTWLANLPLEVGMNQFQIFAVNNGAESVRVPVNIQRCLFADIDCSGVVDIRDFSLYIKAMNWQMAYDKGLSTHYQNYKLADLNQDGRVDIGDFALFKSEYLKHN